MKKILTIAKWEFFGKIKTKSFFIYTVFFPVFVIILGMAPSLFSEQSQNVSKIGLVNTDEVFGEIFDKNLHYYSGKMSNGFQIFRMDDNRLKTKNILIESEILLIKQKFDILLVTSLEDGLPGLKIELPNKLTGFDFGIIENVYNNSVKEYIKSVSKENVKIPGPIRIEYLNPEHKSAKDVFDIFYRAYFFVMLLTITVLFSGGNFIRNLVEEKNSRIMEILISSMRTKHLLTGKLIGLGGLSLFQLFIWLVIFNLFYPDKLAGITSSNIFIIQVVYFLLGYFLFLSIFIGFGAFVNTEQGAQQLSGYLSLLLLLPIVVSILIIQSPDSGLAQFLTYFPLTTSPLMLLKTGFFNPGKLEIFTSIGILLSSIFISIYISSKIFRITAMVDNNRITAKKIILLLFEK